MKRILVWDLPTRLFHWLFALGFLTAFFVANLVDDDSDGFAIHEIVGLVLAFMLVLRLVWGLVGTRWARLRSFAFGPRATLGYFKAVFTRGDGRHTGHNPGAALAFWGMWTSAIGLAVTGIVMGRGGPHIAEELHEILSWLFLVAVGAHLLGLVWHTIRHREAIGLSMVHGHKQGDPADAISARRPVVGLAFVVLTAAWSFLLVDGYDAASRRLTLPVAGITLDLGGDHGKEGHDDGKDDHDGDSDAQRHDHPEGD